MKSNLKIDWCSHEAAKYACTHWHYSRCMPQSKIVKIGAWENDKFIGCILFSSGANNNLGKEFGLDCTECCELTRVALTKHESPVSRIFSIAVKMLKKNFPGLKMIVSYADPEHGHHGGIYQATNWLYVGLSGSSNEYIIHGKRVHGRSVRNSPHWKNRAKGITTNDFVRLIDPNFKIVRGSRKHKYLFPLTDELRKKYSEFVKPYPKRASEAGDGGDHPHSGSATLTRTLHPCEVANG